MKLGNFNNKIGLVIGLKILDLARQDDLIIGVEIRRLNQSIFLFVDDGLSEDKNHWLRRKGNTARRFQMTTQSLQEKLIKEKTNLYDKYGVSEADYVAVAGGIPIETDMGLVATVAVTGLSPLEDHRLIEKALSIIREEGDYHI